LAYDEESGKERKTNMYFFSTGKTMKKLLIIQWESCKSTMGEYSIPAVSESLLWMCFLWWGRRFEKIEKFNALKASRPEVVADAEDTMEFAVEEEAALRVFFLNNQKIRKL
jgi:hypothetical protein